MERSFWDLKFCSNCLKKEWLQFELFMDGSLQNLTYTRKRDNKLSFLIYRLSHSGTEHPKLY